MEYAGRITAGHAFGLYPVILASREAIMKANENESNWLTSAKARKAPEDDSCDLMHFRLQGKLRFKKERNAFMYSREDVEQIGDAETNPD